MQQNYHTINIVVHDKNNHDDYIYKQEIKNTVKNTISNMLWKTLFSDNDNTKNNSTKNNENKQFDILSLAEMGLIYKTPTLKQKQKTVKVAPVSINNVYRIM